MTSRQLRGRIGGLESWSRTVDRTERTAPARAKSPSVTEYYLDKLDPELFKDATDEQRWQAAEAMRRAYFARLAMRSAQARRRPKDAP